MLSEPLDVDAALQQVGAAGAETGTDGETRRAWSGCAKYMLRCVSRRALFAAAQQAPSSVRVLCMPPASAPRVQTVKCESRAEIHKKNSFVTAGAWRAKFAKMQRFQ